MWGGLLLLASLLIAGAALYGGLNEISTTWTIGAFVVSGLVMLFALFSPWDKTPKLTINVDGITDHRAWEGPRLIAWSDLHQMDCQLTRRNNSVVKAEVVCYVMSKGGRIDDVVVDITGLDRDPEDVWRALSKARIEFSR
jgi:hypothetical protein